MSILLPVRIIVASSTILLTAPVVVMALTWLAMAATSPFAARRGLVLRLLLRAASATTCIIIVRSLLMSLRLVQEFHLLGGLELGLAQVHLAPTNLRMRRLIDQLLGDRSVDVGDEAEAAALTADWIAHDLRLLDGAELLEVPEEVLVSQGIVKTSHEHFVADAL